LAGLLCSLCRADTLFLSAHGNQGCAVFHPGTFLFGKNRNDAEFPVKTGLAYDLALAHSGDAFTKVTTELVQVFGRYALEDVHFVLKFTNQAHVESVYLLGAGPHAQYLGQYFLEGDQGCEICSPLRPDRFLTV